MRLSSTKVTFAAIPCIPEHQVIGIRFGSRPTALSLYATLGRCKPFNLARLLLYFAWYWFRQSSQEKDTARVASAVTVPPPPPDLCQCCKSPTLQCQYTGVVANSAGRLNVRAGPEVDRTVARLASQQTMLRVGAGWLAGRAGPRRPCRGPAAGPTGAIRHGNGPPELTPTDYRRCGYVSTSCISRSRRRGARVSR